MIINKGLVLTVYGFENVDEIIDENVYFYTVGENDRLIISEGDIEVCEEKKIEVVKLRTKGRRGDVVCSKDVSLKKMCEEEDKWVNICEIEKGDKIRGIKHSAFKYELGDKLYEFFVVKSIDIIKYSGKLYKVRSLDSNCYMSNSLLLSND